jgi:DNA-binding IclR family transcriptional regulator
MGRRSNLDRDPSGDTSPPDKAVIQVVSRAFDVLRCFDGPEQRLGNLEISMRCGLPRSTVSRLTQTLTRLGQLVYLPRDQKYQLGPGAVAMSTSMLRGMRFRDLIRRKLQDVADRIPGTISFLIPDRFDLVYLEYARTFGVVGVQTSIGTRVPIIRTAAGHSYLATLDEAASERLLKDDSREFPEDVAQLRPRIAANRAFFHDHGYVVSIGLCNPLISGCAVPVWSDHYQTHLILAIGILSTLYDENRMHREVAPEMLGLAHAVGQPTHAISDDEVVGHRLPPRDKSAQPNKNKNKEARDELAART